MKQTQRSGGWKAVALGAALATPWMIGEWLSAGRETELGPRLESVVPGCGEPSRVPVSEDIYKTEVAEKFDELPAVPGLQRLPFSAANSGAEVRSSALGEVETELRAVDTGEAVRSALERKRKSC